ncbi:MAG: PfkB family carbohydrate kinase [Treponema sp.]|jgi:transcriptional regulator with XRE-family HTH domain|nr:PfkB family carbohydrate kinase [Treponema sp.]
MTEQKLIEVGQFLLRLREGKAVSQREAASLLGVSNSLLSQLESGSREISPKLQKSVARVFGCPDNWIDLIHELKIETPQETSARLRENLEKFGKMRDELLYKLKGRTVFIAGDLCVDEIELVEEIMGSTSETMSHTSGGQGYNASQAFQSQGYIPFLFGGVGQDHAGKTLINDIEDKHIISLVKEYPGKQTGRCVILFNQTNRKKKYNLSADSPDDANDYSAEYLREMLNISGIDKNWLIYFVATAFPRYKLRNLRFKDHEKNAGENPFEFYRRDFAAFTGDVMDALYATGAPIVLRIPQTIGGNSLAGGLTPEEFKPLSRADLLIGEYNTFVEILKNDTRGSGNTYGIREDNNNETIIQENIQRFLEHTGGPAGQYWMFFYSGDGCIEKMILYRRGENGAFDMLEGPGETGYENLGAGAASPKAAAQARIGFVDRFAAEFIWAHDPRNPAAGKKWRWEWPRREVL